MEQNEILSTEATYDEIENNEPDDFGMVYSEDGKRLLKCENNELETCTIKEGTIVICDRAFDFSEKMLRNGEYVTTSSSKLKSVYFSSTVTMIGTQAFQNNKSLKEIHNSQSVIEIGDCAFKGCTSLEIIKVPKVKIIGNGAFIECSSLKEFIIPTSVFYIGVNPFIGCCNIEISSESDYYVVENNLLFEKQHKIISYIDKKDCKTVEIPDIVTEIGGCAFHSCKLVQKIVIPESVMTIGFSAFAQCEKLREINIPKSINMIDSNTLWRCKSLSKIDIPNSVTDIGECAFEGCQSLKKVSIPNTVMHIGENAFKGCLHLNEINIPNHLEKICKSVFENCKSLKNILIPESVTEIGDSAFEYCISLKEISILSSVTKIGKNAFKDCCRLQSVVISETQLKIENDVFDGCVLLPQKDNQTKEVTPIKIKKVEITNFRAFKSVSVEFDDFNCIIGKNDAGKSTIFAAMNWFFDKKSSSLNENDFAIAGETTNLDDFCISVDVYFSGVQIPNSSSVYEFLYQDEFLDGDCLCISKYMYHPLSNKVKKSGYQIFAYPHYNQYKTTGTKLLSEYSVEDLVAESKKCGDVISDSLLKAINRMYEGKRRAVGGDDVHKKWYNYKKKQVTKELCEGLYYDANECYYNDLRKVTIYIDFDKENSVPFNCDWFDSYMFYIYTSNTSISDYLNKLLTPYNSRRVFDPIEEEKKRTAQELSDALKHNNILENVDFKPKEHINLFTDDSLVFKQDDSTISIPLKNRGEGLQLTIKKTVFELLANKQAKDQNTIFAFEEPETHLHPSAQIEMFNTIKSLSNTHNYQVFVTTHSPYIVKELAKDNISPIVVKRDEKNNKSDISTLDERVLPYISMNEINYIAFDLASEEFHQELYGQIEIDWFGESNGSKIDKIINNLRDYKCENNNQTFGEIVKQMIDNYNKANNPNIDLLANEFVSPDKGKEPSRCLCHCVRNSIDHPCADNAKWKEYGLIDLSIKILLEINHCFEDIKKTFFDKIDHLTDLDIFPNKEKYCVDEDGNEEQEHSIIYWLKYNYVDKKELFTKTYIEKKIKTETILKIKKEKDKHLQEVLNAVNLLNNYAG